MPGVVFLVIAPGLKPGIDFTGGSSTTLEFVSDVEQNNLRSELTSYGYPDAIVQKMGNNSFFVRTKELQEEKKELLVNRLKDRLSPDGVTVLAFDLVSPVVATETVVNAMWAVIAAAVGIFLYVWWAFRNVPSPLRYGTAAIVALLHDALVVIGVFAALGFIFDVEVNTMFLIALLTIIGTV